MHASAISRKDAASFEESKPACQILILHEDFSAYLRAVEVCRRVMERFASELDFDVKCWNFIELADTRCARHAAKIAGGADIILLSMLTTQLPVEADRWLDFFFVSRSRTEGVLALVLNAQDNPPAKLKRLTLRLEQLAGRLEMEFISLNPGDDTGVMEALPIPAMSRAIRREIRQ